AYIVGSTALKEILINRCRQLIFTTALPPIVGAWWLQVLDTVRVDDTARQALRAATHAFRSALHERGICTPGDDHIVPVVIGDAAHAVDAARRLQEAGFDIRAIRPPSVPDGTARLRVSIHADHEVAAIGQVAE